MTSEKNQSMTLKTKQNKKTSHKLYQAQVVLIVNLPNL